ncbi:MAG: DMT family transporter, partial [Alphaproteobacteria bacterium]|nr:DMT family transporter [Alphaproteobacteria bacterium]
MNNLNAILLVVAAMASFTVEDMFIKRLSETLPVGEILALIAIGSCMAFGMIARIKGNVIFVRRNWRPVVLARAGTEAFAALSFATALSLVDISTVGAVFQSMPLVVTMGAALFLNESVGWRRWMAIVIGFVGVLMIIRPGLSGFE